MLAFSAFLAEETEKARLIKGLEGGSAGTSCKKFPPVLLLSGFCFDVDAVESVEDQVDPCDEAPVEFEALVSIQAFHDFDELFSFEHFHERGQEQVLPGGMSGTFDESFFDFLFGLFVPSVTKQKVFLIKHCHWVLPCVLVKEYTKIN
jgi:hypothetical protein